MNIAWTPEAEQDRAAIWDYLEARDPGAAVRMDRLFSDAVAQLADFPMLGAKAKPLARGTEGSPVAPLATLCDGRETLHT